MLLYSRPPFPHPAGLYWVAGPIDWLLPKPEQSCGIDLSGGITAWIKELYGSGATVRGHSLSVKVSDGAGGDSWYWYELYDGSTFADSVGASLCTGCHGGGDDFVLSPFPLQ